MEREAPDPDDVLSILHKRREYVDALREGPTDVRDLRDELGNARSTVYTAVRELESVRLATRADGGYRLTQFGHLAASLFEEFSADLQALVETEPSLPLTGVEPTIPPSVVVDATIVTRSDHAPDQPIEAFEDDVREATEIRGFSPVTRSRYIRLFRERVASGELEATILTGSGVVEHILERYPEEAQRMLTEETYRLFETDESLPFGLVLFDEPRRYLGMSLYDEDQRLAAYLRTESPAALEWAEDIYQRYRATATELSPPTPSE